MYIKIDGDFKIPTCNKDFKQRNVAKIKEQIFNSNPCYGNASSATRDTHGERERERERERNGLSYTAKMQTRKTRVI
jgi:hypothetical protein